MISFLTLSLRYTLINYINLQFHISNDSLVRGVIKNFIGVPFLFQADLQTTTQKLSLFDNRGSDALKARETVDEVIHHEVKEIGTHMLVISVYILEHDFLPVLKIISA